MNRWGPLFNSLVQQKQWREEHNNADCIADPKMKPGLGKTSPGNDPRSGIGGDKTACDEPRTDDRHDHKHDDIRAPANTGLNACVPQYCRRSRVPDDNYERCKANRQRGGGAIGSVALDNSSAASTRGA